jgi:hypothetical protein
MVRLTLLSSLKYYAQVFIEVCGRNGFIELLGSSIASVFLSLSAAGGACLASLLSLCSAPVTCPLGRAGTLPADC